jgi:hypothetical protein
LFLDAFTGLLPAQVPRLRPIGVDGGVLAFARCLVSWPRLVSGTGPALLLSRANAQEILRASRAARRGGTWPCAACWSSSRWRSPWPC